MKYATNLSLAALLAFGLAAANVQAEEANVKTARAAAQELGKTLKGRLLSVMKAEGPAAAVAVCAQDSHQIALEISEKVGMEVGRRALKFRNWGNMPDDWERQTLERFLAAQVRGEDIATLEHSEVVSVEGEEVFYWAKPILLQQPCTTCHGDNVAADVKAVVADYYPEDLATGFKVGELRGIFSVKKTLTSDEQ